MQLLNQENTVKNQVNTVEQFKVLSYLKQHFDIDSVNLYLVDRFTIKLVDCNKDVAYFKYNTETKEVNFYESRRKMKGMER